MERYRPSGTFSGEALIWALGAAVAGGLIAGALAGLIGQFFRLLLLFEIFMGVIAGFAVSHMVTRRHVRAPLLAGLIGLVGGAAAIVGDEGINYTNAHGEVAESLRGFAQQNSIPIDEDGLAIAASAVFAYPVDQANDAQIAATIQQKPLSLDEGVVIQPLAAPAPWEVAQGWLRTQVDAGMTIGKVGRDGRNVGSGETTVWLVVGYLAVLLSAAGVAFSAARQPYDEDAGDWFPTEGRRTIIGAGGAAKRFAEALVSSDIAGAVRTLSEGAAGKGVTTLDVASVQPHGKAILRIGVFVDEKNQKVVRTLLASRREVDQLWAALEPDETPSAEAEPT